MSYSGFMGLWLPKIKYVCLWEKPDGSKIMDADGNYFCAESLKREDPKVEFKMRKAARKMGVDGGRPVWMEGSKISQMEWEDQMDRYLDGKIPDPAEEYREAVKEALEEKNGRIGRGLTGNSGS